MAEAIPEAFPGTKRSGVWLTQMMASGTAFPESSPTQSKALHAAKPNSRVESFPLRTLEIPVCSITRSSQLEAKAGLHWSNPSVAAGTAADNSHRTKPEKIKKMDLLLGF
jgi:hypothetical protein